MTRISNKAKVVLSLSLISFSCAILTLIVSMFVDDSCAEKIILEDTTGSYSRAEDQIHLADDCSEDVESTKVHKKTIGLKRPPCPLRGGLQEERNQNATICGRFVSKQGKPIGGVIFVNRFRRLYLNPESGMYAKSDENGFFSFDKAVKARYTEITEKVFWVLAKKEGYGRYRKRLKLQKGQLYNLGDVTLLSPGSISGTVVDYYDIPVEEATVVCTDPCAVGLDDKNVHLNGPYYWFGNYGAVTTDRDGTFRIEGIPEESVWVWAGGNGYEFSHVYPVTIQAESETKGVKIVLERISDDRIISGLVRFEECSLHEKSTVWINYSRRRGGNYRKVVPDPKGRFQLKSSSGQSLSIYAITEDDLYVSVEALYVSGETEIELTLERRSTFTVSVVNEEGLSIDEFSVGVRRVGISMPRDYRDRYYYVRAHGGVAEIAIPRQKILMEIHTRDYKPFRVGPIDSDSVLNHYEVIVEEELHTNRDR